jgi:hypothetical protein
MPSTKTPILQTAAPQPVNPHHLTPASLAYLRSVSAEHRRRNMARRASRDRIAAVWGGK